MCSPQLLVSIYTFLLCTSLFDEFIHFFCCKHCCCFLIYLFFLLCFLFLFFVLFFYFYFCYGFAASAPFTWLFVLKCNLYFTVNWRFNFYLNSKLQYFSLTYTKFSLYVCEKCIFVDFGSFECFAAGKKLESLL